MKHQDMDNISSEKMAEQSEEAPEIMDVASEDGESQMDSEEVDELEALKNIVAERDAKIESQEKEYLFLRAEFDNFRKRTVRERAELLKTASESVIKGLLPIVDDFERGLEAIKDSTNVDAVKEGMLLIYNKLLKYLEQNGVKEIPTENASFDTDFHEAIAMVPVSDESQKGKIIDTVSKGYTLNDKVIRHAKVAVGQ